MEHTLILWLKGYGGKQMPLALAVDTYSKRNELYSKNNQTYHFEQAKGSLEI